jgi:hypothetical protein
MRAVTLAVCALAAVMLVACGTTVVDTADADREYNRQTETTVVNNTTIVNPPPVVNNTTIIKETTIVREKGDTVIYVYPTDRAVDRTTVTTVRLTAEEQQKNEEIARAYIQSRGTYAYDGRNLELVDSAKTQTNPPLIIYMFRYESDNAGYGDRSGLRNDGDDTEHNVRVVIMNGRVISVITDGVWNEMTQTQVVAAASGRQNGDICGTNNEYECANRLTCVRESDDSDAAGVCTTIA